MQNKQQTFAADGAGTHDINVADATCRTNRYSADVRLSARLCVACGGLWTTCIH